MYLQILKKDLKRKKTMNVILLIFVILAATFFASGANNLLTVSSALDNFFEKANAPDYWFATTNSGDVARFEEMASENGYEYEVSRLISTDPKDVTVEGKKFECSDMLVLSALGDVKSFDKNNNELTYVGDGELYVTSTVFQSKENDFHEGGKIVISQGEIEREFTIKGYAKDALFGSGNAGITRFLISENDAELFSGEGASFYNAVGVHTSDADYRDNFNALDISTVMSFDRAANKTMYTMDILMAAVLLVVSVCLILISMVILRFIIQFTITEEFREIGVMKAIGIKNNAIRGLYIAKYFAISAVGTVIGLGLSFPFGGILINGVSMKIVISGEDNFLINIAAAVLAGALVVLFSYLCTRKIRKFSPIDAIHSGETGERFKKKGILQLGRSHLPTVPFMALNDILSGIKSYVSMILIFILGTLLVIIPVNTINTLRSDNLITWFNMVKSDHVIARDVLFDPNEDNKARAEQSFSEVRELFAENGIEADVFQEIVFRSNISKGEKGTSSLSFIGAGDVTADMYTYVDGTPPQNVHEVALTHITADQIGAEIGDDVVIKIGEDAQTYTVAAIYQSMNNLGEGVRFHQDAPLDFDYAVGNFGLQVSYRDNPDERALTERKALLEKLYPDSKVRSSGDYINAMMGDIAGQFDSMKTLILGIVLAINALVAVLMVKSFITKEKSEIALLKAIGFKNNALTLWQTMRIGIVLLVSVIFGALISSPLSSLIITPVFRMMGAYSIEFEIRALEVYVVFPLIVLAATALAAFISAQGLRKISSSQISNNE